MGVRLNFVEVSAWSITGVGDGGTVEAGIPGVSLGSKFGVSAGGGGGWFEVTSGKHTDDVYRCFYGVVSVSASLGASLFGEISVGGGTQDFPSVGSSILRTGPLSPDGKGETGDPTGFLGACFLVTPSGGIGNAGYASMVLLGPPRGWKEELAASVLPPIGHFKYLGGIAGFQISSSASVGVSFQPGVVFKIVNRSRGNREVKYGSSTLG